MREKFNTRLIIALAPGLVLGTIAVAIASAVQDSGWRFVLLILAVGSVAAMSWRVGAAALGGTIARAHGVPHRLRNIAGDRRRPTFDRDTGLHAQWYFCLRLEEEIARSKRYDQPFTLLSIRAPDKGVLDAPRLAIHGWLREVDFGGDLGDSLAVCLPNTARSGAWTVVERLSKLGDGIDVTLMEYPADGHTMATLLGEDSWRVNPVPDAAAS